MYYYLQKCLPKTTRQESPNYSCKEECFVYFIIYIYYFIVFFFFLGGGGSGGSSIVVSELTLPFPEITRWGPFWE